MKFLQTHPFLRTCLFIALLVIALHAQAAPGEARTLCIFDPIGANGQLFNFMKDIETKSLAWGVTLQLKAYTDEGIAANDFSSGQCHMVMLTGTRARAFNRFTGTLEAVGGIPDDQQMRLILDTLMQAKAASLMREKAYEVAGILPAGAVYLFSRDRGIDSVEKLQGKKIATMDFDPAALIMVRHVGASVVNANSVNFAGLFNNGSVDLVYAPAVAYMPLELYKGVTPRGGVIDYKIAQMNFQMVLHADQFPPGYAQQARSYITTRYDDYYRLIHRAEADIEEKYWIRLDAERVNRYDDMLREVRIRMRDEGIYHAKALSLMRQVRCKFNPSQAECVEKRE